MQQIIYLVLSICIATFVAIISYLNLKVRGGKSIFILSIASLICYVSYLQFDISPTDFSRTIRTAGTFLGTTLAATALFSFSLEYTLRSHWINRSIIIMFAIIPLFTQITYWLLEPNNLLQFWSSIPAIPKFADLLKSINILFRYSLIMATVWLLGRAIVLRSGTFEIQLWSMLLGPLVAAGTQGVLLLGLQWNWLEKLYLASINLSGLVFTYNTFLRDPNSMLRVSRGNIIENMDDGWIVLDMQNSIIDFNQATAKLTSLPREKMYKKPIGYVFIDFPDFTNILDEKQEMEMERTIKVDDEYHYLNVRVSTLKDDASTPIGRLVIWRDITNRRHAEDARRKARDEMFVLLNAISHAASQTTSLTEFLSEAIYQIIYPFRCQVVLVYLQDDRSNGNDEHEYYLAAHLGLSSEISKGLSRISESSSWFEWINENRQPLLLEDSQDGRIPMTMRALLMSFLLVIPLIVKTGEGEKFIGSLILGRKEPVGYKQDEIVRLTILADHIATLIDSDRRRKLSIALSERQRLMRDVHDSLSQKLYGLVTLTEAAQAAREAETDFDYEKYLSLISTNARQAVKELRLFLFQMRPIDLDKEGLISVLHHRLAAVEGRADIKARFLAPETISISKKKEVALYYITQEALNNVLRHAFAKSVTVTLKQGYKYVTLEVEDDGCGFDKNKLERGGMGLKNIKERVKQENGKLKISSKLGKGTVIQVSFEIDVPNKSSKK